MNKITCKAIVVGLAMFGTLNAFAQKGVPTAEVATTPATSPIFEPYDPLIPQLFAFDKESQVFAGINNVDNTIDIISYHDGKLSIDTAILVDVFDRRHDVHFIYRPLSVAIYEGRIVYLATHRDSCYLAVLDLQGNLILKHTFLGHANAFSYSPTAKELYIAGENATGYDIIVVSTAEGFENIEISTTPSLHYQRPRKSEEIKIADPYGIGITVIAVSVVFLSLLALFLAFKNIGKGLIAVQNKRAKKLAAKASEAMGSNMTAVPVNAANITGEEFAAVAAAIYMYDSELHDEENTILTINKVTRAYSPWSSKIYGLNSYFNKR